MMLDYQKIFFLWKGVNDDWKTDFHPWDVFLALSKCIEWKQSNGCFVLGNDFPDKLPIVM